MRVHELIEILKKMEPNAEIIVGSNTLLHPHCGQQIGVWPAIGVDRRDDPVSELLCRAVTMTVGTQASDVVVVVCSALGERLDVVGHGRCGDAALGLAVAA